MQCLKEPENVRMSLDNVRRTWKCKMIKALLHLPCPRYCITSRQVRLLIREDCRSVGWMQCRLCVSVVRCLPQPMGSERMEMRKRQMSGQQELVAGGTTTGSEPAQHEQAGQGERASNACCFCWCCCCSCSWYETSHSFTPNLICTLIWEFSLSHR